MGAIKLFSADSRDYKPVEDSRLNNTQKDVNPNPKNFKIISNNVVNSHTIIFINYPDCTNYEGNKILVYEKDFDISKLIKLKKIDPHFYDAGDSPIARFEPTEKGMRMAVSFCENYISESEVWNELSDSFRKIAHEYKDGKFDYRYIWNWFQDQQKKYNLFKK